MKQSTAIIRIANDEPPKRKRRYQGYFDKLEVGQCLVVEKSHYKLVDAALRKYLAAVRPGLKAHTRTTSDYGDGYGRVWLLDGDAR